MRRNRTSDDQTRLTTSVQMTARIAIAVDSHIAEAEYTTPADAVLADHLAVADTAACTPQPSSHARHHPSHPERCRDSVDQGRLVGLPGLDWDLGIVEGEGSDFGRPLPRYRQTPREVVPRAMR